MAESHHDDLKAALAAGVRSDIYKLISKKYLVDTNSNLKLTQKGVEYLKDKHPKLIVLFDRLIDRSPILLKIFIILIGFVASIFSIIQFLK